MNSTGESPYHEFPDESFLDKALNKISQTRQNFFATSDQFYLDPSRENSEHIVVSGFNMSLAISFFTTCVLNDELTDNIQKSDILASTICHEEKLRALYFNKLLTNKDDGPFMPVMSSEGLAKDIDSWLEIIDKYDDLDNENIYQTLTRELVHTYAHNVELDLIYLKRLKIHRPKDKLINIRKYAGKHTLDIARFAIGMYVCGKLLRNIEKNYTN
jgi:hypothetical protein